MTFQYLAVLGVLIALSVAGYLTFLAVTVTQEGRAAEVNVAGRQRMLSQQIAFFAWRLVHAEAPEDIENARHEVRVAADLMESSHEALINGDPRTGLPGNPSPEVSSLYFGPAQFVDRRLRDYVSEARALANLPTKKLAMKHELPRLSALSQRANSLVPQLDSIVRQYQLEDEERAVLLTRIGTIGLVLTLGVLAYSGLLVFRPLVRRVEVEMEDLDVAQERYTLAMQGTNEGLWDWDIETDEVYLSPRLRSIFQIDENKPVLTGEDWLSTIHPADRREYLSALRAHLKGDTPFFTSEHRIVREGGAVWIRERGLALRSEDGQCYRMAGSVGDITERRRNHEELRLAASVFANSPQGIMITDPDGIIVNVNPAFTDITGYTKDEVLGDTPAVLSSGRHDAAFYRQMWETLDHERHWTGEVWNRHKSGKVYAERLEITVLTDDEGKVVSYIGQFTDITQIKQDEERLAETARELARKNVELEDAVVQANEANRAKSEFLAAMSHELRTPLNAVIGFSEAMLTEIFGPVGDDRYAGYLKNIRESGRHLLDVINDILDVSKVEAGKIELAEEPVDVSRCIESALRLIHERADGEGISVNADIPEDLPAMQADERRLKQVLLNLLSNSIKFTNPGGSVKVTAAATETYGLSITVADSGIGIAEEDLARVLTPFTQVDSQLARKYDGTGLGLPLTKGLVEAHGGKMSIKSKLGEGTQVTVHFPPQRVIFSANYEI